LYLYGLYDQIKNKENYLVTFLANKIFHFYNYILKHIRANMSVRSQENYGNRALHPAETTNPPSQNGQKMKKKKNRKENAI